MTARVPENVSTWLVDWRIVTIMGKTMPPRDRATSLDFHGSESP